MQMNISSTLKHLPASASQEDLHAAIDEACADSAVDGVLVQLPLPPHLNEYDVMERLDPQKDVDGFHPLNMGRMLARNAPPRFVPATALGCMQLLNMYNISVTVRCIHACLGLFTFYFMLYLCLCSIVVAPGLHGAQGGAILCTHAQIWSVVECKYLLLQKKHVVVVGDSNIVGTPLSVLLRDAGAGTVTVCHRIAYNNIFEDRLLHGKSRQLRSHAHACLPRLPGPYSPVDTTADSIGEIPRVTDSAQVQVAELKQDVSRRSCSPPDAARVAVVQKSDATEIIVEVRLSLTIGLDYTDVKDCLLIPPSDFFFISS